MDTSPLVSFPCRLTPAWERKRQPALLRIRVFVSHLWNVPTLNLDILREPISEPPTQCILTLER